MAARRTGKARTVINRSADVQQAPSAVREGGKHLSLGQDKGAGEQVSDSGGAAGRAGSAERAAAMREPSSTRAPVPPWAAAVLEDICPVRWAGTQAVVTLPEDIDVSNAGQIREKLLTVINRGAAVLVADMTATASCDYAGADAVIRAYQRAVISGTDLRLVVTARDCQAGAQLQRPRPACLHLPLPGGSPCGQAASGDARPSARAGQRESG